MVLVVDVERGMKVEGGKWLAGRVQGCELAAVADHVGANPRCPRLRSCSFFGQRSETMGLKNLLIYNQTVA